MHFISKYETLMIHSGIQLANFSSSVLLISFRGKISKQTSQQRNQVRADAMMQLYRQMAINYVQIKIVALIKAKCPIEMSLQNRQLTNNWAQTVFRLSQSVNEMLSHLEIRNQRWISVFLCKTGLLWCGLVVVLTVIWLSSVNRRRES